MAIIVKKLTINTSVSKQQKESLNDDAMKALIKKEILRYESLKKIKQFR